MTVTRMTTGQIEAVGGGWMDRAGLDATTEHDVRRQMIDDSKDPDAVPRFAPSVLARDVRRSIRLTQAAFAVLLAIRVSTLRNWEQNRFTLYPAVRTLLRLIERARGGPAYRARASGGLTMRFDPFPWPSARQDTIGGGP